MNNTVNIEIERKFLVNKLPSFINLNNYKRIDIVQTYLNSNNDSIDVRIRNSNNETYSLDIKNKNNLIRNEISLSIDKEQYDTIFDINKHKTIYKTRYILNENNNAILSLDIYLNKLDGLMIIEFESSEEEVLKFKPKYWYEEEVTNNSKYKNSYLAINGL